LPVLQLVIEEARTTIADTENAAAAVLAARDEVLAFMTEVGLSVVDGAIHITYEE